MTIKDMETRTGMTRANIRFYEKEGLLLPRREENGYRDYTEADLQELEKIKLLRMLEVPLEEIRLVQSGQRTLSIVLEKQLVQLSKEQAQLDRVQTVCQEVFDAGTSYAALDAGYYLDNLEKLPLPATDAIPRLYEPWRRYFARLFDYAIYSFLLYFVLVFFATIPTSNNTVLDFVRSILIAALALLLEPFLLHWFGTTPGKWILGLRVTRWDGTKLSYSEALNRTANMLHLGVGWGIPYYGDFCSIRSYIHAKDEQSQPWEADNIQTLKDKKVWRIPAYIAAYLLMLLLLACVVLYPSLPHHLGNLTTSEFVDNFNAISQSDASLTFTPMLDENGQIFKEPNVIESPFDDTQFSYDVKDGSLSRVCVHMTNEVYSKSTLPDSTTDLLTFALRSFVQAQAKLPLSHFDQTNYVIYHLENYPLDNWEITANGVRITQEVSSSSQMESATDANPSNEKQLYITFTMEKEI